MRSRSRILILLAIFLVITGACLWKLGYGRRVAPPAPFTGQTSSKTRSVAPQAEPIRLLSQPGLINSQPPTATPTQLTNPPSRFAHRLSNTSQTVGQLARRDKAIRRIG